MLGRTFLTDTVISEKMLSEVLSPGMGKRKAVAQQRLLAFLNYSHRMVTILLSKRGRIFLISSSFGMH